MFKKLFTLLVVVSMLFTMTYIPAAADDGNNSYTVTTKDGGTITIVTNSRTFNEASANETEGGWSAAPVATDNVAKVGNTEYDTIEEAIAAWTAGTTLTLLDNVTLTDVITLKSIEHHILNLGTYTMTAASGKNAIEITCEGRSSASYALTVNADANNPGGITATGKSCVYYKKSGSTKDRPIILINNGVFTGSYSLNITSNGNTNCPQIWINGGIFNSYMNLTKCMLKVSGGTFHAAINCTGDQNAYRQISGGRFKSWQFMTADKSNKFALTTNFQKDSSGNWIGNYDVGVYVDDNGYIVVGGSVVTESGETFEASSANYSGASSYLQYSSAKDNGLYYTSVEEALADNNKASGSVTVYVDELDMTGINYKGTIVVPEGETLTVVVAEGTTPAWTISGDEGAVIYTDAEGNELVNGENGFEVKPLVDVAGDVADVDLVDGTDNSYNITLKDGVDWPGSVEMTFKAEGDTNDMAYIVHEHEDGTYIYVGKVVDGELKITNTVGFSTFTVNGGGLQDAIKAAEAGDTIVLIDDVADEAITVDKSLTIKGDVTLNNVTITGSGTDVALTLSELNFTGSSYINANNIAELTVTGVTADVDPAKITGRASFIVLGTSELTHGLKLVVKNNEIKSAQSATDFYSAAIFGWRYIDNGSEISGNFFGAENNRYTFIAVKTMNAMDGATITIANNTIYGTTESYALLAFDLYQNCSRANAYTVISNSNVIDATVGESYPVIAFNLSGNTAFADSTNIILMDNGTTVNGNALTLADIDVADAGSDYDKFYGVDVVTDADGKVISGTFGGDMDTLAENLADGYVPEVNDDGSYNINKYLIKVTYPVGNPVYPEGKVEYYNDMREAVPHTTNCPRLEGATITLLDNMSGLGMRFMENGMVLDLNGYTYTLIGGTGSNGTETSGFQIRPEVTEAATIKNGTIKLAEGVNICWMFNSYATDFIVEDVVLDCTNLNYTTYGTSCYVSVSRAEDNVQFLGNTKVVNFNSEAAGSAINVGDTMVIGDNVDLTGLTVELDAGATLTTTQELTVVTADGYMVTLKDGVYTSVEKVAQIGETVYSDLHEAMVAAKSGETVYLLKNVDLAGTEWEPVSFRGHFNGNGYTISNLVINKPGVSNTGFITSLNGTFENVTFENPTVTGGECAGVVAGRAGGSAALAKDITVTGTIKVETTHSGYARAGVIVGGWAYGRYVNITVDGIDAATSYIKHTGGGDGRYVAGIVGHSDDVDEFTNCTVKNITISGGWLCGGITGPGPSSATVSGCAVENLKMNAYCSGGMFGWYYGSGTIEDSSVKNVEFTGGSTNNGAIGGYSKNTSANVTNVTIENVKNSNGAPLLSDVASINGVYYTSLAEAIKAAQNGDVVTILPGEYGAIDISNKNITIQGTVGANGELLTTIKGGNPAITGHRFNGTIKDLKIVDAWKVMYAEPAGNVTIDNVYVTGATYGFHLVAYSAGLTWTIQNSYMDLRWANSFGVYGDGDATIVIKDNTFEATNPYYTDGDVLHVNSFLPDVTVTGNVFGENAKIRMEVTDTSKLNISGNYHADGVDNAFVSDSDATVFINEYYADEEMTQLVKRYVQIGENYYESFEAAAAVAQAGDEIILLADVAGDITVPAGVIFNGNGKRVNGIINASGVVTFAGITKAADLDVMNGTIVNIPAGASLQLDGSNRVSIGLGCTFNIIGTITDAKTADKATITPSLIMPGASFTGAGVTFNVTNAYVKVPSSYASSSKSASGTFDFNIINSIWESAGKLAFESQSVNATVNFELKDSVLTTGSHLIFGVSRGEIVIDNSNVNVGTSRQIENQSTITIKNGSVVNGAVATSSNAKNPGTIIVDNATYAVTGEFSGSDLGTGTLILKNGAIVSAGSITKANIKIDATGMQVGDEIKLTANLSKLVGTVEVINNGKLDAQIVDGKIVLVEKTLSGSGTEADPYQIGSVEDLILFRDSVNAGETKYSAPGVYTVLTADIDLAGINWIGIGSIDVEHGYMGNFNGNGYTIKNLTITNPTLDSDGYAYAGLFSITEGTDKNNQNVIKNLIIENVTISTTGHIVAAAIAYPYYTVVENVKVCGDINITGGDYTAGVLAYTRRCVNATGLSVVGNAGSAITGRYTVGGVISDIQMNGGLVAAYSNFSVEGVTVTGANNVGGISGIIASQTLDTCSVKNVTLVCKNNVGIVSGSLGGASTISGVVYENVSGATDIIGGVYDGATDVQAMIGDVYYATLEAALAAAKAGDTITLLTPYVVKAGETLTIDKDVTISATHGSEYAMIHVENGATMNLNNGKITYAAGGNNTGAAVWVEGALVQNGGTIEVTGSWTFGFGVDLRPNAWGTAHTVAASFVMNGGKIASSDTAVRVASNSSDSYEELGVKFTMNGGEIESAWDAIFVQHLYAGDLDIVIVDGTVTGENSALRIYGNAGSDIDMNVAGGTFNGSIKVADAYVNADAIAISGGTFTEAVAEAYCADGYIPKDNGDGTYSVKIGSYAAIINGVKYESIAEAIKAAQNGDVVTILPGEYGAINISNKNITIQGTVGEDGELLTTIKGGNPAITGHGFNGTIKDLKIVDAWKVMYAEPAGNVTIDNVYVTGATYGFHLVAYSEGLAWTIQNSYMDLSWANSFGVYGEGDAAIVIKGNKFVSTSPYYEDYGALHVNTFLPNVTVEDNVFGENAKIALNLNDTSKINISNNYHADGVDNAFVSDSDATVFINEYYADEEMTQLVKRYVQIGENYYESFEAAAAVAKAGDKIILLADAEIAATTNIDKSITIDGNGYKITQAEGFAANGANVVFDIFGGATVTFENLTFDAIKNVGIIRTVSANLVMNNCTIQNCEQTVSQGLLRLACGNATITNSKFLNNDCKMTLTFGYNAANDTDVLLVDSCTFEGNTCGETAVLYFADGAYGKVTNTKFIDNTVSSAGNAATLYMGWGEGFEVSGCLFDGNKVTTSHATTKRFASAIFADGCKIENNAFLENTAIRNGEIINTVVAVAAYYGEASVSDNYWKGGAPAYTVEYSRNDVEANGYYKDYNTETGELSNYVSMVAKVGQYTYASLAEAFKAATDGGTVTLLSDVALTEGITIPADANVTLDLAGHTIIGTPAEAKAYAVITNKGNLTINDSVGDGKIVCNHTLEGSTAYAVNTIVNSGKLTLKAGTIENVSTASNQIGYAIDNNSTSFDAILVVEGGKIVVSGSNYYDGVRLFCNSESKENSITVSGGEVSSIWLQNPSDGSADRNTKDVVGSVIITGGKVSSLYLEPSAKFEASIIGGEIGSVGYFQESEGRNLTDFITGGIFSSDPSEFCAPLYHAPYVDGKYAVEKNESIVAIVYDADGNVLGTYDNLRDALEALGMEDLSGRIVLEKDTTAFSLQVFEGITLDLNGYTLETKYITVFNGGYLVDTSAENTGLLKCAQDHTAIQTNVVAENGVMSNGNNVPVWDEAKSGYIFTDYIFTGTRLLLKTEGEVSKLQYEFAVFTEKYARQLLKDGASDNDLSIIVRISWTKGDTTYYEDVRFSDNSVGTVIGENGANKKVFGLLVSNYEGFENLAFQAVILSGTEMVASTAPVAASSAIVSE